MDNKDIISDEQMTLGDNSTPVPEGTSYRPSDPAPGIYTVFT